MNRYERKALEEKGVSKETIEKMDLYSQPCTILEVVKLGRAIATDVVSEAIDEYRRRSTSTIVALTLQLDVLKKIVVEKGLATPEELQSLYEEEARLFDEQQKAFIQSLEDQKVEPQQEEVPSGSVDLGSKAHPVEIQVERRGE